MAMRHQFHDALVGRTPAVKPRHVGFDPGFVDENEAVWVEADLLDRLEFQAFGDNVRPLLLGGDERFFLNEIFKAFIAFHRVVRLTSRPSCVRNDSSVRSGCCSTALRNSVS